MKCYLFSLFSILNFPSSSLYTYVVFWYPSAKSTYPCCPNSTHPHSTPTPPPSPNVPSTCSPVYSPTHPTQSHIPNVYQPPPNVPVHSTPPMSPNYYPPTNHTIVSLGWYMQTTSRHNYPVPH